MVVSRKTMSVASTLPFYSCRPSTQAWFEISPSVAFHHPSHLPLKSSDIHPPPQCRGSSPLQVNEGCRGSTSPSGLMQQAAARSPRLPPLALQEPVKERADGGTDLGLLWLQDYRGVFTSRPVIICAIINISCSVVQPLTDLV